MLHKNFHKGGGYLLDFFSDPKIVLKHIFDFLNFRGAVKFCPKHCPQMKIEICLPKRRLFSLPAQAKTFTLLLVKRFQYLLK